MPFSVEQLAQALDRLAHHAAADVVGVVVRDQRGDGLEALLAHVVDDALDVPGRIDQRDLARRRASRSRRRSSASGRRRSARGRARPSWRRSCGVTCAAEEGSCQTRCARSDRRRGPGAEPAGSRLEGVEARGAGAADGDGARARRRRRGPAAAPGRGAVRRLHPADGLVVRRPAGPGRRARRRRAAREARAARAAARGRSCCSTTSRTGSPTASSRSRCSPAPSACTAAAARAPRTASSTGHRAVTASRASSRA